MKEQLLAELNAALEYFERSTSALTEDDSTYAPVDGVYTVAQHIAHVAQTIDWFLDGAFRPEGLDMDFEAHDRAVRTVNSLAQARASLARSAEQARSTIAEKSEEEWAQAMPEGLVMSGLPRAAIFGGITDHTAHHRGALTVYARLRGKVPPMPYMDMPG